MTYLLTLALTLLPYLPFISLLIFLAVYRPVFFLSLCVIYFSVTSSAILITWNPVVAIGAFNVYPQDLMTACALVALLIHMPDGKKKKSLVKRESFRSATVLLCLLFISILFWTALIGLKGSINFWREYLSAFAFLNYGLRKRTSWTPRDLLIIVLPGCFLLSILVIIHILVHGIGTSSGINVQTSELAGRSGSALGAMIILISMWTVIFHWTSSAGLRVLIVGSLFAEVIFLQHRTVWVAFAISALVKVLLERKSKVAKAGFFGRVSLFGLLGLGFYLIAKTNFALSSSLSNNQTFIWRIQRWASSMSIQRPFYQWIFGAAFGPSNVQIAGNFSLPAHNEYVTTIESLGIFGLLMLLILIQKFFMLGYRNENAFQITLMMAVLAFSFTYTIPPIVFAIIGLTQHFKAFATRTNSAELSVHHMDSKWDSG